MTGAVSGATEFIVAAYVMGAVILVSYSLSLVSRLRKERELAAKEAARRKPEA